MHARTNLAAAASLVIAMGVATLGTIWQADPAPQASCKDRSCRAEAASTPPSLAQALDRVEAGLSRMAGIDHRR